VRASGDGAVLVGCSTGGPPALEALLAPLPANFSWPIVVAQHMPASFTGPLAKRLDRLAALHVTEVRAPVVLQSGHVYIGRGDADLVLSRRPGGVFAMSVPAGREYPWHPSMNRLVSSALNHLEPAQLIAIIMTGMGNDGVEAVTALCARGGRAIAESEDTAVVWGMPGELVRSGSADWIEPLPRIASRLAELVPDHAARS
jgi:two-component system chemotaxis response regulator CheB